MQREKPAKPSKETAEQARAEAEARREAREERSAETELGGRKGPDPARYGDWEHRGIVSDF